MTQYTYCELSDLQIDQCHHCIRQTRNLGPVDGGLYPEEGEGNASC